MNSIFLLYMLMIYQIQGIPKYPLNMYNVNSHQDRYCLLYHTRSLSGYFLDGPNEYLYSDQLMSYCFRSEEENNSLVIFDGRNSTNDLSFTFAELKERNVTSQMLLSWSSSIEMAEQYEIFLNNYSNSLSDKDIRFYNCTESWFGPYCRFTFDYQMEKPFNDIVRSVFKSKNILQHSDMKITCYKHLSHCKTLLSCLDWREICDAKKNCLDGSDEEHCWQLEINECNENEYRCYNGQCIPIEFFRDGSDGSDRFDCLDQTDEIWYWNDQCFYNCDFQCEESTCPPGLYEFPCGDGQCMNEMTSCYNGRDSFLPYTICSEANCTEVNSSKSITFHTFPLLFGHVRFMVENISNTTVLPDYVYYDAQLCPHLSPSLMQFNNLARRPFKEFEFSNESSSDDLEILIGKIKDYFRGCLITTDKIHYCNYSTMYQCINSTKCISKYRLLDGIPDCPFNDDETINDSCSLNHIGQRFKCKEDDDEKCFAQVVIRNGKSDCKYGEDEEENYQVFKRTHVSFTTICDGIQHILPILIDEQNETDETNCEHWPCNNTYSRCNGFWLCKDGADEINCPSSTCPRNYHSCVLPTDTSEVSCLSITQANNNFSDCLGGTDERTKHLVNKFARDQYQISYKFHCWNDTNLISYDQLCDNIPDCLFDDDEIFCNTSTFSTNKMCENSPSSLSNVEYFFCMLIKDGQLSKPVIFKLQNTQTYPLQLLTNNISFKPVADPGNELINKYIEKNLSSTIVWWCHRGIPIYLKISNNITNISCLCLPSYYGDRCQYQNQRISLTIRIRVSSDWRRIFIFLITLIDNERNIQSYDYIEYLPIRDCRNKYNIYLLYTTRPKNLSKTYSVQIDLFNQDTLDYRTSWIFPLQFSFLPVHRLAILLTVPFLNIKFSSQQCSPSCIHGKCISYINDPTRTFCHCEPKWSGLQCNVKHKCDCAPGALCISDSICLCQHDRYGPRCYLSQSLCNPNLCLNGGQCTSIDIRYTDTYLIDSRWMCICSGRFIGDHCEIEEEQTQIDISFHSSISIPSFLLVHFIDVHEQFDSEKNRTSIAKKIEFYENSLTIFTPTWFNIALVQISNEYYLIILQTQTIYLDYISTTIIPSHRCHSITELFDEKFIHQHLLKRIKYYHIPCQQQSDLVCFHDDVHICFCTLDRTTNCFEFNHNITYDCEKYHYCGKHGQCFQDVFTCATSSFCACHLCYFGSRCQFSTKISTLSLDIILGYHIRLKTPISQQSIILKIAIALTIIMFIGGYINSFLCYQTFREKQIRKIGCGHYLYILTFVSLITISIFVLKITLFLITQISSINNYFFLYIQCISMDFFLRFLLSINDWLSACISIERTFDVIQGIQFNKIKSKKIAKWMSFIVILFTGCSYIYDPIYRRVIDDEEEQRTWCITQYSNTVQNFDGFINIFHFSIPFAINCISAIIIIIVTTHTRSISQKLKPYREHLHEQFYHHIHLLISPLILVLLAIPRLIIAFLSGCMKSPRDSWFYLIGYFTSFIPLTMTFIVYVLPSNIYKKKFREAMQRFCRR